MKKILLLLNLALFTFIHSSFAQDQVYNIEQRDTLTLTFGSCNKQYKQQPLWDDILSHKPEFFMFLGDNIYGDTNDMQLLEDKYEKQKAQPGYEKVREQSRVIGVWDDHDYGQNDAGKEYPKKQESQQLFLDFFDVPENSPRREREGVYSSHQINWNGQQIKILLLDSRYHRDTLERVNKVYKKNETGTILGERQWKWLEEEMSDTEIDLYILACGIQFIAEDHVYEKWANFPAERQKLFDLITRKQPQGVLLLSGDRHIAEISSIEMEALEYPLTDITSSGLTHTWSMGAEEYNRHRKGELIAQLNYGVLNITTMNKKDLKVSGQVRGDDGVLYLKKELIFEENK